MTIGDQLLTAAVVDGVLVYSNAETTVTLKPGHIPASFHGITLSEAALGRVVVGTESDATTMSLPTDPEALTIGTHVLTPVTTHTGAVYANADTTVSLDFDGAVTSIDGIRVSAAAGGVIVVGTGSDATTMTLATTDSAHAYESTGKGLAFLEVSASSTAGSSVRSTAGSVESTAVDSMGNSDSTSSTDGRDGEPADSAGDMRIMMSPGWRYLLLTIFVVLLFT